MMRRTAGN